MPIPTSLERSTVVLDGGTPDRVPVCLLNFMQAARMTGLSMREYCTSGEAMASAHLAAWERFGHDVIDLENGVATLAQAVGCTIDFEEDSSPPWVIAPALVSIEDVGELRPIDLAGEGLLPAMLEATRILADTVGDRVFILAEADQGPFSLASQIVGIEEFLVALMDPDRAADVERLLDYTSEQVTTYARALIEAGAHLTMMGESIAGPDVCAPDIYRRVAQPRERHVIGTLASEGKAMGLHICGDATRILGDMVDTGARFVQLDHKVDRAAAKAATHGRTTLIGTLDPSAVLALGTPDDVRRAARTDLESLAGGGGYMIAPGCALPYHTPEANIDALVETAQRYGRYGSA